MTPLSWPVSPGIDIAAANTVRTHKFHIVWKQKLRRQSDRKSILCKNACNDQLCLTQHGENTWQRTLINQTNSYNHRFYIACAYKYVVKEYASMKHVDGLFPFHNEKRAVSSPDLENNRVVELLDGESNQKNANVLLCTRANMSILAVITE